MPFDQRDTGGKFLGWSGASGALGSLAREGGSRSPARRRTIKTGGGKDLSSKIALAESANGEGASVAPAASFAPAFVVFV